MIYHLLSIHQREKDLGITKQHAKQKAIFIHENTFHENNKETYK